MKDDKLEQAINQIQNEAADPAVVESAATRVWANLQAAEAAETASIRGCAGFEALFADYRAGRLPAARALLVKDHLHECVACRKAYAAASGKVTQMPAPRRTLREMPYFRWAVAAAVAIAAGLGAYNVWNQIGSGHGRATVQVADGALFRIAGSDVKLVKVGEELPPGTEFRTAKASGAVLRLDDGSLVELSERASASVDATRRDTTIHLGAGRIIVEAAKRRSGHLYVATRDCRVAVTGTVFSVNSGMKGSRVAVIEGEVRVSRPGVEDVLHSGDQVSTSSSMSPVAVKDEIAWSRDAAKHAALLREFSVLQQKIAEIPLPGVRYSSRLMGLLPPNTVVYAAIPNLGPFLGEAHQIFRQRVESSPVLNEWWQQKMEGKSGASIDEIMAKVRGLSDFLGDEVVFAAVKDDSGKIGSPIFVAEVKRPGLREFLDKELHAPADLKIVIESDLVAFSPDAKALNSVSLHTGGFGSTPFGQRIAASYTDGVGLLFSADLEQITKSTSTAASHPRPLGFDNLKYLVVEQKNTSGNTETRAALSFDGGRKGIASWLAEPAPIRALDFVSPDATMVTAGALKNPGAAIDEMFAWMEKNNPEFQAKLAAVEATLGVSIRADLAGPLGGEVAFALDGPPLPPSWKVVLEVYDPARLSWTIQKLVEGVNRESAKHNAKPVTLSQETVGGRVYYTLALPDAKLVNTVCFTFADGYLIAAPNRTLLDQALQYQATGNTLPRSAAFQALVPRDHHANFSGLVYHNLAAAASTVSDLLGAEQQQALKQFSAELKPTLIVAYGEPDRITLASTGSIFSLTGNRIGMMQMFGINHKGTTRTKPAYR